MRCCDANLCNHLLLSGMHYAFRAAKEETDLEGGELMEVCGKEGGAANGLHQVL